VAALCLFSALAGRFCFLVRPFDGDAAIFIYMGKMVAGGGRLGHDMVDNKFPTVGLMTSLAWRAFGVHWAGYVLLQTSAALAGAWVLGGMAARHVGAAARWPTTLFAVVYLNFTTAVFGGFQLETMLGLFAVLGARSALIAIECDSPADSFVAGLCVGCGLMLKPTALAVLAAWGAGLLWTRRRWALHAAAGAAGVAIPVGVAIAYLVSADLLGEMPALYRQISTYASQSVFTPMELLKPITAAVLIGFPILVRGWVCRRQVPAQAKAPPGYFAVFAVTWLVVESAGVLMQRRMYAYHFLPIVPPAALVFGIFLRTPRPWAVGAALLPMILLSVQQAGKVAGDLYTGQRLSSASVYLKQHARVGDAVWLDYWPRTALETGLAPGSRFPFTFLFCNYDRAGVDYGREMIADFERTRPRYIFLPVPLDRRIAAQTGFVPELVERPVRRASYVAGWKMIQDYTLAHYDREAVVDNEIAYRRKRGEMQSAECRVQNEEAASEGR
jgi:hypothetical protein